MNKLILTTFAIILCISVSSQIGTIKMKKGNPIVGKILKITDRNFVFEIKGVKDSVDAELTSDFLFNGSDEELNKIDFRGVNTESYITKGATVNGALISDLKAKYIRIVGISKLLSSKVNVDIEFGQHNKWFSGKDTRILSENGKPYTFNSMIDAMNFMSEFGYRLVQSYVVPKSNQLVYHYLMEKQ